MDKEQLNFRSFTDTANGEGLGVISSAWNLQGTPTLFVVDHKGVIRYRRLGIPDAFAHKYGSQDQLMELYGLQPPEIAQAVRDGLGRRAV